MTVPLSAPLEGNSLPTLTPLVHPPSGPSGEVDFGATITNIDLSSPSPALISYIKTALFTHKVLIFPSQSKLTPTEQFNLVHALDPDAPTLHGHNDATASYKGQKSLLHGIGNSIVHEHPEVKLVGGGVQGERFGGRKLEQVTHWGYHKFLLTPEERESGFTRWHRWHMDAGLYKTSPPTCTTLLAVQVPKGDPLTVRWDDGSDLTMEIVPGSTAFVSGAKMYDLLSEEDKEWVDHSEVEYAPWPYQWGGAAKGNTTGLGTYSEGKEMKIEDLPPWDPNDQKRYPMVWHNPLTREKHLQLHSVCVQAIHVRRSPTAEFTAERDLTTVRKILYALQRPVIDPQYILAYGYQEGDLVMFWNRGVYHSATDYPERMGTRSMLQAHVPGSTEPK